VTTEILFSSNKLGVITNDQLQLMLDRFDLGQLISSAKTAQGVMEQTMFVTSSAGEYVFKGNPLYQGQFIEEKLFVENLKKRTKVPVPYPYLVDESEDIFGWSYSLMPRLPGRHMNSSEIQDKLNMEDKIKIVELLAKTLVELHSWNVDEYGEFDPINQTVRPFEGSYKTWLYNRIRFWLEDAKKYSVITSKDIEWVESLLDRSQDAFKNYTHQLS
jgi:hygromycin-B 7''-O-kinase